MKNNLRIVVAPIVLILLFAGTGFSQGGEDDRSFTEKLKSLAEDNGSLYLQPFVTAFGTNMNSGLYHTAKIHGLGGFDLGIRLMVAMVPDEAKLFEAVLPVTIDVQIGGNIQSFTFAEVYGSPPYDSTASVFGEKEDGLVLDPNPSPSLPAAVRTAISQNAPPFAMPGGIGISMVPLAVPQVSVGLIMGTEVNLRYLPPMEISEEIGEFEFLGFGLSHDIGQWIPMPLPMMPDLAVGFMFQTLKLGDILESNHTAFNARISKSFPPVVPLLTVYFGAQLESSDLTATYEFTNPITSATEDITFELDGDNGFRLTSGLKLTLLPFIGINVDYSKGEYTAINAGLTFSFR